MYNSSFIVCSNNYACVAFVSQNPDKKKVLTSQRTFDSEGEKNPPVWLLSLLFCLSASNNKPFFSGFLNNVLQRRSCTSTTRRRPYIMTQMRMQIPENPNLTMASWSSTGPYARPGASSVWSGRILIYFLYFLYTQYTDTHTVYIP